ncbi:helix-turn-helix domain-containing protein [Brevibacillus choshinensis]|uniref:helix-turn-helix domain-containing protein n=1 Tax=Brevibacillus choshinensis TaxID=54911 RepID=UPI002E250ED9|nr:helix-turn-helix domain-containing protein [Brevibacillus choshinensis]
MSKETLRDTLRVFVVPTDIFKVEGLSTHDKLVYCIVRSFANSQTDTAFPSYATIADLGSMSRRQAIKCVTKLLEMGLLSKEAQFKVKKDDEGNMKVRHTSNMYTIHTPEVVNTVHQAEKSSEYSSLGGERGALGGEYSSPEYKNLKESFKKDDEKEKQGQASADSDSFSENKELIEAFAAYASSNGLHQNYVGDITKALSFVNFRLTQYTLGTALNKTLEAIESRKCSHPVNYFMTVLENEYRKAIR